MKIATITLAAATSLSMASPVYDSIQYPQGHTSAPTGITHGLTIDLAGIETWDAQGSLNNTTLSLPFRPNGYIQRISWNISISTYGASWLSEATIALGNSTRNDFLFLTPGFGDSFPGTGTYRSDGFINLNEFGVDFVLNGDGLLNLEFFESFDDVADAPDAVFLPGSYIIINFPTPGSLAILGFGALVCTQRRRES